MHGQAPLENSSAVIYQVRYILTIWPSNPTSDYLPKRNENLDSHQNLYVSVYHGFICNCPQTGNSPNVLQLLNVLHTVVCPYNGILYSNQKGWSTDSCYNMEKPQMLYAAWKKPEAKGYVAYDSIYMTFWKRQNIGTESRLVIVRS